MKSIRISFYGISDFLADFGGTYKSLSLVLGFFLVPFFQYMLRKSYPEISERMSVVNVHETIKEVER